MDKPKHFGKLGIRAAVPWVRCPLCGGPMNLRERKRDVPIYGCASRGACSGARQASDVDDFFEDIKQPDIVSAVAEVDSNGGRPAHLVLPDGPANKFVCRKSRLGLSRLMREEQSKRFASEKRQLAHIIPGQWNPSEDHMALLTLPQNWGGELVPEGALVLVMDVINNGEFYMVAWPTAPKQKREDWHTFKVNRSDLRAVRPGDTLWSIDPDGKTTTKKTTVPQYEMLVVQDFTDSVQFTVVGGATGKEFPMTFANARLIAVVSGGIGEGSFFHVEGVKRVVRVSRIEVEEAVYVTGDNGGRWKLSDIEPLTDEELDMDVAVPVQEDVKKHEEGEFDFEF